MKLWDDLVNSALFGTERRAWQVPAGSTPVESLLRGVVTETPADLVLQAASILTLYRRGGSLLPRRAAMPPECPVDPQPRCGPLTFEHLRRLSAYPELIPTALAAMAQTPQRLPEELLPAFLELASRKSGLREAVAATAGVRGKWLAAQNPDWSWLIAEQIAPGEDVRERFETGSLEDRLALLRQLRKSAPEAAVELIQSTWAQEKADPRSQLLETLRIGLSMADEPFLEERLNDKSLAVRWQAADLLASLPESRLSLRMVARLQPLLQLESTGILRRTEVLEVTLPDKADPTLLRDGIRPNDKAGEKTSILAQMLALVPPAVWSRTFSRSPQELVAAAAAGDWKDLLLTGWLNAAERHRDREWASALAPALPAETSLEVLLNLLEPGERDTVLRRVAKAADESALMAQIGRFPGPWSPRLTHIVLERIRESSEVMRPFLCRAALAVLPRLDSEAVSEIKPGWPPEMSDLAAALQFKHALLRDIRNRS